MLVIHTRSVMGTGKEKGSDRMAEHGRKAVFAVKSFGKKSMKKLTTLLLAAGMVAASFNPASAVDVKVDGRYQFEFQTGSEGFHGDNTDHSLQRVRLGLTFIANENLSGYFQLQAGTYYWGTDTTGNSVDVTMRQAYVDWTVPSTDIKIRMGRHAFDLPSYASLSPMLSDLVADGVVVSVPFADRYNLTGFWTRMARGVNGDGVSDDVNSPKYDLFGLVGSASFDNLTVSPWAIYGHKGDAVYDGKHFNPSNLTDQGNISGLGDADISIFGAGLEWKPFAPVTLALDAAYGFVNYSLSDDQEGWYAVGKAAYATSFGEPTLLAWYASGDSKGRDPNSGQIPIIYGDFNGTSTYFDNTFGPVGGHRYSFGGTWGVSAQINGMSFLSGLTHDFSVTYFAGTNDKYNGGYGEGYNYLTTEDSAVEFDLLSTYEIYKNLKAALELAYIIEDFDTDPNHGRTSRDFDNDWRAALHFEYKF